MKSKISMEYKIRERLLASSTDVLELMHILGTGRDPFVVLDNLDFVPNQNILLAMYREISAAVKSAVPKPNISRKYADKTTREQAEAIVQDVYTGELDLPFAKDLLNMIATKVNALEMIRLQEQLEIAAMDPDASTTVVFNVQEPKREIKVTYGKDRPEEYH